jgi:hypothetical protein
MLVVRMVTKSKFHTHKCYTQLTDFCKTGTKDFCAPDVVSNVRMLM